MHLFKDAIFRITIAASSLIIARISLLYNLGYSLERKNVEFLDCINSHSSHIYANNNYLIKHPREMNFDDPCFIHIVFFFSLIKHSNCGHFV